MKTFQLSRTKIVKVCAILLGVVLLIAGTGKALDSTEFTFTLEGLFFTPAIASIIAHSLPWLEITLGLLLILGIIPKIISVVCIVLISGFIVSNSWGFLKTQTSITCGDCFGIWETFLGSLSPLQALLIDVVLLCFALIILTQIPARFPLFGFWRKTRTDT
jgi:uncharacterized membrane protein YphA (DoxX/SURF4 family)